MRRSCSPRRAGFLGRPAVASGEEAKALGARVAGGEHHRHDGSVAAPIEVTFRSDGLGIAGHLRIPSGEANARPGLVLTGPLTGVKEQVTGSYAEALAGAGYVTLAFATAASAPARAPLASTRTQPANSTISVTPSAGWPRIRQSTPTASAAWGSAWAEATPCASLPLTLECGRWSLWQGATTILAPCVQRWESSPTVLSSLNS